MLPIHELLNRIKWDPTFNQGRFVIGYENHVADKIVLVDLSELDMDPDNPFMFDILGRDGNVQSIPIHRHQTSFQE